MANSCYLFCRELDHIVREMSAEKTVLARVVDDARNTIDQLKFELSQTRSSVSHLTGQLSQSFASREESAEIAARYLADSVSYRLTLF